MQAPPMHMPPQGCDGDGSGTAHPPMGFGGFGAAPLATTHSKAPPPSLSAPAPQGFGQRPPAMQAAQSFGQGPQDKHYTMNYEFERMKTKLKAMETVANFKSDTHNRRVQTDAIVFASEEEEAEEDDEEVNE
mmetsp:Transcript_92370/g.264748  ORF Transcript_92370/g.264748 Transcript_92370/m.264748 type:complete len:132 (+) Transcript_92370:69-464(+)